ncbi:MAG: small basic protein [Candidatus Anammoxibacter sp.]
MSIDKSLVSKDKLTRERNVYSKSERIDILKKNENWNEDDSVFGLRKTKVHHRLKRKPTKSEAEEATDATATDAAATEGKGAAAAKK